MHWINPFNSKIEAVDPITRSQEIVNDAMELLYTGQQVLKENDPKKAYSYYERVINAYREASKLNPAFEDQLLEKLKEIYSKFGR